MSDAEPAPLKLLAKDVQDLAVVSAMMQDAIVPLFDIAFLAKERTFVLAVNRFRWEHGAKDAAGERVHSGLRFDSVSRAQFRNVDRENRDQFVSMLSITYDSGVVVMHFSGGAAVRLEVDALHCSLTDLDEPWPTIWRPEHAAD